MAKPTVKVNPVASRYASDGERIIEFFDVETQLGGLISIRRGTGRDEGTLFVEPYRIDRQVVVLPQNKERDQ